MESCYREVAKNLIYPSLKDKEKRVPSKFLEGNDVFISVPIGYGKSPYYSALSHTFDLKKFESMEPKRSIVLVVSPLIALMKERLPPTQLRGLLTVVLPVRFRQMRNERSVVPVTVDVGFKAHAPRVD